MKRHDSITKVRWFASLLAVILLLNGCASKRPPAGVHFPITNGFHSVLPTEEQRILIWGDLSLSMVAEAWLRSHHYSPILVPSQKAYSGFDHEVVFRLATELRAEFVLLLEQEELKTGALIESHCGPRFNLSVTIRGISQVSQGTVFRGSAYYPHCVERTHEIVENLTCQALATAWGFRPSGQLEIPSSLACTTGQVPLPTMR